MIHMPSSVVATALERNLTQNSHTEHNTIPTTEPQQRLAQRLGNGQRRNQAHLHTDYYLPLQIIMHAPNGSKEMLHNIR